MLDCRRQKLSDAAPQQAVPCSRSRRLALASTAAVVALRLAARTPTAQALELQQLLPGAAPAPLDQLLSPNSRQTINNPGVSWAIGTSSKQLLYPAWMEGTWQVTASFVGVTFPKGQQLVSRDTPGVTKASMVMTLADVGAAMDLEGAPPVTYLQRFYNNTDNNNNNNNNNNNDNTAASSSSSDSGDGGVIADRPFNIQQQVDAFLRYPAVQQVDYNPAQNPTRLAVIYKTPRKDTSEIKADLRKAEIFINNRGSGYLDNGSTWVGWENYRQVNQARQQGSVGDYLAAWSISRAADNPDVLSIRHRSAAFLQPQDARYFDAGPAAVVLYDYSMVAKRAADDL